MGSLSHRTAGKPSQMGGEGRLGDTVNLSGHNDPGDLCALSFLFVTYDSSLRKMER